MHPISNQALSLWQLFTRPRWLISPQFLQLFARRAIHLAKVILVESLLLLAALFIFDQWRAGPGTIDGLLHLLIFSWTPCPPNFTLIQHFHDWTANFGTFYYKEGTTCQTWVTQSVFWGPPPPKRIGALQLLEYQMVWCRFYNIKLGHWPSPHSHHQCTLVAEALVILPGSNCNGLGDTFTC